MQQQGFRSPQCSHRNIRAEMPQLSTPPWRQNKTPRRQRSRDRPTSPAVQVANGSPGAVVADETLWRPTDFPSLHGTTMCSTTPKRHTPKKRIVADNDWRQAAMNRSAGNSTAATAAAETVEKKKLFADIPVVHSQPRSADVALSKVASTHAVVSEDQQAGKSSSHAAVARAVSMPPDGCSNTVDENRQAAEAARVHGEMMKITNGLLTSAEQVRLSNFRDAAQVNAFMKGFADAVKIAPAMGPACPFGTADADPAAMFKNTAMLALHLINAATCNSTEPQQPVAKPLSPIAERSKGFRKDDPCVQGLATPCRSRVRFSVCQSDLQQRQPSAPPCAAAPAPAWFQGASPAPRMSPLSPGPLRNANPYAGTLPAAQVRKASMDAHVPRRSQSRQYTVVNPRTGERLTVSSVVPFSWRESRRLRIVDPKTGVEVLPYKQLVKEELNSREKVYASKESRSSNGGAGATGATGRVSIGSVASTAARTPRADRGGADDRSETPAPRQRRRSIVGGTVKEGSSWALEPAAGGFWDWPLSRQEKKDRVLLLGQLQMLSEIEHLQTQADEQECY